MPMPETVVTQIIVSLTSIILLVLGWWLNREAERKAKLKKEETPLVQADFHTNIKSLIRMCELMEIEHINEGRVKLIKDYGINKIQSFEEPAMDFAIKMDKCISECKGDCNTCNKLLNTAMEMLFEGLKYEETYKNLASCPEDLEALITFNDKFKSWHQPHVDRFSNKIQSTCHTPIFKECLVRSHVILLELENALFNTINSIISASTQLNGSLTGKVYKGNIL